MVEVEINERISNYIGTGFQWEAVLYLALLDKLTPVIGEDKAIGLCGEAMYEAGLRMGRTMARKMGRNDLKALKEAWDILYPPLAGSEFTGDQFNVIGDGCFICKIWQSLGLNDERINKLADGFCSGDRGFVNGFNPEIKFEFGERIMKGGKKCEWKMSAPEANAKG